jgi:PAS domain S-box-containing protein
MDTSRPEMVRNGLRKRAEELWREQQADRRSTLGPDDTTPLAEALNLLHELEVHQIELEMQNDELRRAQLELAISHAKYFDLYDLAPVGYLTLSKQGIILQANLTAAKLLGLERNNLVDRPITDFIVPADQDLLYFLRKRLGGGQRSQECELRMVRGTTISPSNDSLPLWVRLQATAAPENDDSYVWRAALSDVSERKHAEDALQVAHDDLERKVQERTAELALANEMVGQSRDQLRVFATRLVQAQENERRAIARELHDGAGQALTCMMLDLGALARDTNDRPVIAAKIRRLSEATDGLLSEMHTLAANLHPAALDRLGMVAAVRQLVSSVQGTVDVILQVEDLGFDGRRLAPDLEVAVYRVVQEALSNAIRHARASRIGVVMQIIAGRLLVTIEDDGVGFKVEPPVDGHLGLLSMHERIAILGGNLTIESSPGAGATIYVEVPL